MKREHNEIEQSLPPFYENLVFWAPLEEGDLTDHISGVEPTTDTGCSVTWDEDKQAYKLYTNGVAKASLRYNCMQDVIATNADCTLCLDVNEVNISSIYNMYIGFPPYEYGTQPYNYNLCYMRHDRFNSSITNLITGKIVVVYAGRMLHFYLNGLHVNTIDWSTSTNVRGDIGIVCINQTPNGFGSGTVYAKNAIIYNRALTAEEVAQL